MRIVLLDAYATTKKNKVISHLNSYIYTLAACLSRDLLCKADPKGISLFLFLHFCMFPFSFFSLCETIYAVRIKSFHTFKVNKTAHSSQTSLRSFFQGNSKPDKTFMWFFKSWSQYICNDLYLVSKNLLEKYLV